MRFGIASSSRLSLQGFNKRGGGQATFTRDSAKGRLVATLVSTIHQRRDTKAIRHFPRRGFHALLLSKGVYNNYAIRSACANRLLQFMYSTILVTANKLRNLFNSAANSLTGAKRIATRLFHLNIPVTGLRVVRCRPAAIRLNRGQVLLDRTTHNRNKQLFTLQGKGP